MKLTTIFALLFSAVLSPVVSARLTLLRLAQGDHVSKLRGLAPRHEEASFEAELYVHGFELLVMIALLFFLSISQLLIVPYSLPTQPELFAN